MMVFSIDAAPDLLARNSDAPIVMAHGFFPGAINGV